MTFFDFLKCREKHRLSLPTREMAVLFIMSTERPLATCLPTIPGDITLSRVISRRKLQGVRRRSIMNDGEVAVDTSALLCGMQFESYRCIYDLAFVFWECGRLRSSITWAVCFIFLSFNILSRYYDAVIIYDIINHLAILIPPNYRKIGPE